MNEFIGLHDGFLNPSFLRTIVLQTPIDPASDKSITKIASN